MDLDMAVYIFTEKFKFVLNHHAPWIIFQLRKNYSPWLTKETKDLMKGIVGKPKQRSWLLQIKQALLAVFCQCRQW